MYIMVMPLRGSLSRHPYIYSVSAIWEESISEGGLVEIPLGKNLVEGVIAHVNTAAPLDMPLENIRPIVRVISKEPIIDSLSLRIIEGIALLYFLPIHKVISMFLPRVLLRKLDTINYILGERKKYESKKDTSLEIAHILGKNVGQKELEPYFLAGTVIILPDALFVSLMTKDIEDVDSRNIGIFTLDGTPTKKVRTWIDIYAGKYDIIVGTRRILYYNLGAYDHIVYVEDAFGTEEYHYPIAIRNLDLLREIEKSKMKKITILTSSPTLLMLSYFRGKKSTHEERLVK